MFLFKICITIVKFIKLTSDQPSKSPRGEKKRDVKNKIKIYVKFSLLNPN